MITLIDIINRLLPCVFPHFCSQSSFEPLHHIVNRMWCNGSNGPNDFIPMDWFCWWIHMSTCLFSSGLHTDPNLRRIVPIHLEDPAFLIPLQKAIACLAFLFVHYWLVVPIRNFPNKIRRILGNVEFHMCNFLSFFVGSVQICGKCKWYLQNMAGKNAQCSPLRDAFYSILWLVHNFCLFCSSATVFYSGGS